MFATLVTIALFLAMRTRDWRLKVIAAACATMWLITNVYDTPEVVIWWLDPAYSIAMISLIVAIQARGRQERARGEPLAMWILVPFACEVGIALTYVVEFAIGAVPAFMMIQTIFVIELIALITIGFRQMRLNPIN